MYNTHPNKRKIKARKLAAKPPVSTENRQSESSTVAGSLPVAVTKESLTVSEGAGIKPSACVDSGNVSSNISELSNVKQCVVNKRKGVILRPKQRVASSQKEPPCQKLPRIHPALSSIRRVIGHAYACEKCKRDAAHIDVKMYLCKLCSRRSLNDRHICLQCYENSDHINCALTLIDCG